MAYYEKSTPKDQQLKKNIVLIALIIEMLMFLAKYVAYKITGSVAILSDALESIAHIFSAMFSVYALWLMSFPADKDHPFGHGNISYIAAIVEASMMLFAGITTFNLAIHKVITPEAITSLDTGFLISSVLGVINFGIGMSLIIYGKRKNSLIIKTNGKHVLSDAITSFGIIIGLLFIKITGYELLDAIVAFLVAAYICISSIFIFKEAVTGLMDKRDEEDDQLIRNVIEQHYSDQLLGFHALRHRHVGSIHQVDFHLLFKDNISLQQAHTIASQVESAIDEKLGHAVVTVHIEPFFEHKNEHHLEGLPEEKT